MQDHLVAKRLLQKSVDENSNAQISLQVYAVGNGLHLWNTVELPIVFYLNFGFRTACLRKSDRVALLFLTTQLFIKNPFCRIWRKNPDVRFCFCPPYSPDLNPIEKKWAWLKRKLQDFLQYLDSFDMAMQTVFQVS